MGLNPDYNLLDLSKLKKKIQLLHNSDNEILLLDYPFSYLNNLIKDFIDVSIYVDTPLDVALVRRAVREYTHNNFNIDNFERYLTYERDTYLKYIKDINISCDHIIDGNNDVETNTKQIVKLIKHQYL